MADVSEMAPNSPVHNEQMVVALPLVAIIVLNWNGKLDTIECLESVSRLNYPNYEVVVVDNGSTDDSVETISKQYPGIALVQTGSNLGYAGGNNVGIRWALDHAVDYVLLLNNDTIVSPDLLRAFVIAKDLLPANAVLGAKIFFTTNQTNFGLLVAVGIMAQTASSTLGMVRKTVLNSVA